jgi:hypothetical protein
MSRRSILVLGCSGLLLLACIAYGIRSSHLKRKSDTRCAAEGQAVVETFLRDGAAGAFDSYGSFVRLVGTGYNYPVWNIAGYHYLTLDRTGIFTNGSVPIRIYVRDGWAADSATPTVGKPTLDGPVHPTQGARITVKHFDLKP